MYSGPIRWFYWFCGWNEFGPNYSDNCIKSFLKLKETNNYKYLITCFYFTSHHSGIKEEELLLIKGCKRYVKQRKSLRVSFFCMFMCGCLIIDHKLFCFATRSTSRVLKLSNFNNVYNQSLLWKVEIASNRISRFEPYTQSSIPLLSCRWFPWRRGGNQCFCIKCARSEWII